MLDRAIETTNLVMEEMGVTEDDVKISKDWRLNERHYGKLQGKDKK
jgi:bisphosphoglycerate-dependent phosphoglycerate mutase